MSLPKRMKERKTEDRALEARLRIRKNDPTAEAYGGVVYSTEDIKDLENEKLAGVRRYLRHKRWLNENQS